MPFHVKDIFFKSIFYSNAVWSTDFPFCSTARYSDQCRHIPLWSGLHLITLLKFHAEFHWETPLGSLPAIARLIKRALFIVKPGKNYCSSKVLRKIGFYRRKLQHVRRHDAPIVLMRSFVLNLCCCPRYPLQRCGLDKCSQTVRTGFSISRTYKQERHSRHKLVLRLLEICHRLTHKHLPFDYLNYSLDYILGAE